MLLADDRFENISRLGDVRKIDLGLELVTFGMRVPGRLRWGGGAALCLEMRAHLVRFVIFQRTRVRLLLSDSDLWKNVKNRLALDFQFSGQIVNSNFAHPPSISFELSR